MQSKYKCSKFQKKCTIFNEALAHPMQRPGLPWTVWNNPQFDFFRKLSYLWATDWKKIFLSLDLVCARHYWF